MDVLEQRRNGSYIPSIPDKGKHTPLWRQET